MLHAILLLLLVPPILWTVSLGARLAARKRRRRGELPFRHEKALNVCFHISSAFSALEILAAMAALGAVWMDVRSLREKESAGRNAVRPVSVHTSIYGDKGDCARCDAGVPWMEGCHALGTYPPGTEFRVLRYSLGGKGDLQCIQVQSPDGKAGWSSNHELFHGK